MRQRGGGQLPRRAFSQGLLASATAGLWWLEGRTSAQPSSIAPPLWPPVREGIAARLAGRVLRLDYTLAPTSTERLQLPPADATFVTALELKSQRPLCCKALSRAKTFDMEGPLQADGAIRFHARVNLAALMQLPPGFQILVHASFWQHRSGVVLFRSPS